jgi:hypothetical protein
MSLSKPDVSTGTTPLRDEEADIVSGLEWRSSQEDRKQVDGDTGRVSWRHIPGLLFRHSHSIFPGTDTLNDMQDWTNPK